MKTRILAILFVAVALLVISAGPIAAAFPLCSSVSYCLGYPNSPCTCNYDWKIFSTCGQGCDLPFEGSLSTRPLQLTDLGLPSTVLDELGVFSYDAR